MSEAVAGNGLSDGVVRHEVIEPGAHLLPVQQAQRVADLLQEFWGRSWCCGPSPAVLTCSNPRSGHSAPPTPDPRSTPVSASGNTIPSLVDQACLIVHGPTSRASSPTSPPRSPATRATSPPWTSTPAMTRRCFLPAHRLPLPQPHHRDGRHPCHLSETLASCNMSWSLSDRSQPKRMAVLALGRRPLPAGPAVATPARGASGHHPMVISNHTTTADDVRTFGGPSSTSPRRRGRTRPSRRRRSSNSSRATWTSWCWPATCRCSPMTSWRNWAYR